MNKQTIITALLALTSLVLVSCGSDEPHWADPEAHEKTELLREQYGPLMIGTWHYGKVGESQRFFEKLSFKDDGTFTGMRKWQTRQPFTVDGELRYTDWETLEMSGTFAGTWSLSYWAPYGGEKRNDLQLTAIYDGEDRNYMAYSTCLNFGYADEITLHIQGYYAHDDDDWVNYQRGDAESSF
jgi:hypothetical protein